MRKILGIDLGVASIGWALISEHESKREIIGMGSRIIPLSTDDKDEFSSGNKISKNQKRTLKRTQRKGYDRYQLRRKGLTSELLKQNMLPDEALIKLKPRELWGLRANAVTNKIELKELGRVLYHLNQKRGYKSSRSDANLEKKDTEYVAEVKGRHDKIKEEGITIGQKFFNELQKDEYYRIRQQVFPREAYIEEFEAICKEQQKHYPQIITDEFISRFRDEIIYYQRKLKSQKGLVSVCEFEGFWTKTKEGKEVFAGPKVAPKSSPLFQVCKIWETINTLTLKNKQGEQLVISIEKKKEIYDYLDLNERLTSAKLFDILGLNKTDGWYGNKQIEKGLQGNLTKTQILKAVKDFEFNQDLLKFDLTIDNKTEEVYLADKKTGEIIGSNTKKIISPDIENLPLYKLWHTIYSIQDLKECANALMNKFKLEKAVAEKLANIDFTKSAFGNKSVKAMRKILPYLMEGFVYSDASSFAGYNHSSSQTKDENLKRKLLSALPNLAKNSIRQPVVEKILNQLINVVNALIIQHGNPDEIRIELARELKQSRDERNDTFTNLNKRERENDSIRKILVDEFGIRATRNNVIKYRLFKEINNDESKVNSICIYCGKAFGVTDALKGSNVDVEHIIPKSLLFDDSQSNKTLSHRHCNQAKDKKTAYDFMSGKSDGEFQQYIERVDNLYKNKIIGKAKRDKLLMSESKIPKDFIERQLRETQYIAKKAKEMLEQVSRNVWSTSGSVTAHLRNVWGWDDVLMNLQLPKYRDLGLTEWEEWETHDGQKHKREKVKGWSKRDDHRHHAVDALTIACTQQGFIQRMNTLSSQHNRDEMYAEVQKQGKEFRDKLNLLDSYLILQKPFNTKQIEDKAAEILVSFKAGKKVATIGTRKIKKNGKTEVVQTGIIIPRGALSEESVYGKILTQERDIKTNVLNKYPAKYLFENPQLIYNRKIKSLVIERLEQHEKNAKTALASLKKEPIYLGENKTIPLEYGTCYKEQTVIKYPIEAIKAKDLNYIVDSKVRELIRVRLEQHGNKEKEAFKQPLYFNEEKKILIKSVRLLTGLSSVEPVKKDERGKNIGFVLPKNNHHIAIYIDENGKKQEHVCSFWHVVERKKYGIPAIIKNPKDVWDKILLNKNDYPESFLQKIPNDKWSFNVSLQQNEMFVIGLSQEDFDNAIKSKDKKLLSQHLYRVQKFGSLLSGWWFRHHLETAVADGNDVADKKKTNRVKVVQSLDNMNGFKIRINNLGETVQ